MRLNKERSRAEVPSSFVSQIIYPKGQLESITGHAFLVGWNLENFRCSIAFAVEAPIDSLVDLDLSLKCASQDMLGILTNCSKNFGARPVILGEWYPDLDVGYLPNVYRQSDGIWLILTLKSNLSGTLKYPTLHSLYSLGCLYETSCYIFQYDSVNTDKFECLYIDRASPNVSSREDKSDKTKHYNVAFTDLDIIISQINASWELQQRTLYYLEQVVTISKKTSQPIVIKPSIHCSRRKLASLNNLFCTFFEYLNVLLSYPTCVWFMMMQCLYQMISSRKMKALFNGLIAQWVGLNVTGGIDDDRASSTVSSNSDGNSVERRMMDNNHHNLILKVSSEKIIENCRSANNDDNDHNSSSNNDNIAYQSNIATDTLLNNKNNRNASNNKNSNKIYNITLRNISLSSAYIAERASLTMLALRKCALFSFTSNHMAAQYKQRIWIEIHSLIILIWLDVMLGCIVGYYIFYQAENIVYYLQHTLSTWQSFVILDTLDWFHHSPPAGIKLHTLITLKISSWIVLSIQCFNQIIMFTRPVHVPIIRYIACIGTLGMTVQLSFLFDMLRLLTIHVSLTHRILSVLHQFQLQCLQSLLLLFTGQKNNILRKRVDTCNYDQSQLLCGTVLFSVAIFLFPNCAVYFLLFAVVQLGSATLLYILYSMTVTVKEFPYYTSILHLLQPARVSDGIVFHINRQYDNNNSNNNSNVNTNNDDSQSSSHSTFYYGLLYRRLRKILRRLLFVLTNTTSATATTASTNERQSAVPIVKTANSNIGIITDSMKLASSISNCCSASSWRSLWMKKKKDNNSNSNSTSSRNSDNQGNNSNSDITGRKTVTGCYRSRYSCQFNNNDSDDDDDEDVIANNINTVVAEEENEGLIMSNNNISRSNSGYNSDDISCTNYHNNKTKRGESRVLRSRKNCVDNDNEATPISAQPAAPVLLLTSSSSSSCSSTSPNRKRSNESQGILETTSNISNSNDADYINDITSRSSNSSSGSRTNDTSKNIDDTSSSINNSNSNIIQMNDNSNKLQLDSTKEAKASDYYKHSSGIDYINNTVNNNSNKDHNSSDNIKKSQQKSSPKKVKVKVSFLDSDAMYDNSNNNNSSSSSNNNNGCSIIPSTSTASSSSLLFSDHYYQASLPTTSRILLNTVSSEEAQTSSDGNDEESDSSSGSYSDNDGVDEEECNDIVGNYDGNDIDREEKTQLLDYGTISDINNYNISTNRTKRALSSSLTVNIPSLSSSTSLQQLQQQHKGTLSVSNSSPRNFASNSRSSANNSDNTTTTNSNNVFITPPSSPARSKMTVQQQLNNNNNNNINTTTSTTTTATTTTAYMNIEARRMTTSRLFSGYAAHIAQLYTDHGLLRRLLTGIWYGRPRLDIQLIHGTADIIDRRMQLEAMEVDYITSLYDSAVVLSTTSPSLSTSVVVDNSRIDDSQRGSSNNGCNRVMYNVNTMNTSNYLLTASTAGKPLSSSSKLFNYWHLVKQASSSSSSLCYSNDDSYYHDDDNNNFNKSTLDVIQQQQQHCHEKIEKIRKPNNGQTTAHSRQLLFMVLLTCTLNLALLSVGITMFVVSVLPQQWTRAPTILTTTTTTLVPSKNYDNDSLNVSSLSAANVLLHNNNNNSSSSYNLIEAVMTSTKVELSKNNNNLKIPSSSSLVMILYKKILQYISAKTTDTTTTTRSK